MARATGLFLRTYLNPLLPTDVSVAPRYLGRNSGNLIFSASAQRLLSAPNTDVVALPFATLVKQAERANEEGRHVVIPMANAFRPSFAPALARLTKFIKKLTVPVTILGVGAQGSLTFEHDMNPDVNQGVKEFAAAVLDHGPSIGVRGQFTADYLRLLGISDVEVIGCPSMFLKGPSLHIREPDKSLFDKSNAKNAKLSINLSPRVHMPSGWVHRLAKQYPKMQYVAQDKADLNLILGGKRIHAKNPDYPGRQSHPLLRNDRAHFYLHAPTWINAMQESDFVFGHRIHGNVAGLLAGTPSHLIAHDTRTLELAEYFQIPFTLSPKVTADTTVRDLYEGSSWGSVESGHAERVDRIARFLESHALAHTARTSWGDAPFDAELNSLSLWGPEVTISPRSQDPASLDVRRQNLRSRPRRSLKRIVKTLGRLTRVGPD